MESYFVTTDLWLAAYLQFRNIPPQLQNKNDRIVFLFPQSDTLYKLITAFNSGDFVPISEYIDIYKMLKVRMFQARVSVK